MAADGRCPYAGAMAAGRMEEYAALVTLFQAQPQGLSWKDIAGEALEAGSAVEVWERHVPPVSLTCPGRSRPCLPLATWSVGRRGTIGWCRSWTLAIQRVCAVFMRYHQSFSTLSALVADDSAVSVVGSREASAQGLVIAAELAHELVARKMTVVSGLARGSIRPRIGPRLNRPRNARICSRCSTSTRRARTSVRW